jgi:hypothetical protein
MAGAGDIFRKGAEGTPNQGNIIEALHAQPEGFRNDDNSRQAFHSSRSKENATLAHWQHVQ